MNDYNHKFAPIPADELEAAKVDAESVNAADKPVPTIPPDDAPQPDWSRLFRGKVVAHWAYRSESGKPVFFTCRVEEVTADGKKKKDVFPVSWVKDRWKSKWWPAPRPLYNFPNLVANPTTPVIVVEGEKCADAGTPVFVNSVVTTSSGGSERLKQSDWTVLAGRRVVVFRDDDEPGRKYEQEVVVIALKLGCSVSVVDTSALKAKIDPSSTKPGWDIADAVVACPDIAELRKAIASVTKPGDPPPAYVSAYPFTMNSDGLFKRVRTKGADGEDGADGDGEEDAAVEKEVVRTIHISGPFEVLGKVSGLTGGSWGLLVRFKDARGRIHMRYIPVSEMHGDAAALCGGLGNDGLYIDERRHREFRRYLKSAPTDTFITQVSRTGWHIVNDADVFVLPGVTIGNSGNETIILDKEVKSASYAARGTVEEWRDNVASLAKGHALPVFAISASFAGPLLRRAGQEGGGFNFDGKSSRGKTTLLCAAASSWGRGSAEGGIIRSWNSTGNALEGVAAGSTDTGLFIDELGQADGRQIYTAIYALANGKGRSRLNSDSSLKDTREWLVMILSTSEVPIGTKLEEDSGRKARAGQLIRIVDIHATDRALGVYDHAPDNDGDALSKAIKLAARTYYGSAGPEFVRRLLADEIDGAGVRQMVKEFVKKNAAGAADGQITRAADRFGIVAAAGELATKFGLTGWDKGEALQAAAGLFHEWIKNRGGTESAETRQSIEQVRLVIERFGDSRFQETGREARIVNDRLGWRSGEGADREWWILPEVWKSEVCAGVDPTATAKALAEREMLRKPSSGRGFQCTVTLDGRPKAYVLTASILDGGGDEQ